MQPDALRAHLNDLAARLEGASADPSVRWAVIRGIEQAWDGEPGRVREQNRRSVLKYLTGHGSTKQLSDAHILALNEHLQTFDCWAEYRAGLRAGARAVTAYYNEIDPYAAQWLRNLIAAGLIAPGDVDERSIVEVKPDDLSGYTQCHFFAGIGVWSHALRRADWPDSRPAWTGSCPCQPFSGAGKGDGAADPRHLWPAWFKLIRECRPVVCFGEQVASADGLAWLDLVHADLEEAGYAVGALDLCAAGAGAPHIRQRLYFVADAQDADRRPGVGRKKKGIGTAGERGRGLAGGSADSALADTDGTSATRQREHGRKGPGEQEEQEYVAPGRGGSYALADADGQERRPVAGRADARANGRRHVGRGSNPGLLGNAVSAGLEERGSKPGNDGTQQPAFERSGGALGHPAINGRPEQQPRPGQRDEPNAPNANARSTRGAWSDAIWIDCRDGKRRPAPPEPEFQPLAYGASARVGRLRAYGNAIVAPLAAEFIAASMAALPLFDPPPATPAPHRGAGRGRGGGAGSVSGDGTRGGES